MSKEKLIELKLETYKLQDELISLNQKNTVGMIGKEYASYIVDVDILYKKIRKLDSEYISLLEEVSKDV